MEPVHAVVLAAGKGKRMHSDLPKVLHPVCGQPLILYVLDALQHAGISSSIVVVGRDADRVREAVGSQAQYVEQAEPRGTGDAVLSVLPSLPDDERPVLVLYGDTPLLTAETIRALAALHRSSGSAATLLSARVPEPAGYGRVLRDGSGRVRKVVEDADCSAEERQINEINAGTYVFRQQALREALRALTPNNAQREYYITDTIGWLLGQGQPVAALEASAEETIGVNSRQELAAAEALMRRRLLDRLMEGGVTVIDPATTYVHAGVQVGPDTVIHPQSYLEGTTAVGARCTIGPQARLVDAAVGDGVTVVASSLEHATVGEGSTVGPYSRLRPGTRVGRFVEIGNFAELKNAVVGDHTKVHHMSYLGDVTVGVRVNIGAGTVTCNYDGTRKHHTEIEDEAFIGSDTMLIAPIRIGKGAVTGAGSVVNKDVPPGGVAVGVPARVIRYVTAGRRR